eukprot:gene21923-14233_t
MPVEHIVLLKLRELSKEEERGLRRALNALRRVNGVIDLSAGPNYTAKELLLTLLQPGAERPLLAVDYEFASRGDAGRRRSMVDHIVLTKLRDGVDTATMYRTVDTATMYRTVDTATMYRTVDTATMYRTVDT